MMLTFSQEEEETKKSHAPGRLVTLRGLLAHHRPLVVSLTRLVSNLLTAPKWSNVVDIFHDRRKLPELIALLKVKKLGTLATALKEAYNDYLEDSNERGFKFKTRLLGEQVHKLYEISGAIHKLVPPRPIPVTAHRHARPFPPRSSSAFSV